MVNDKKTIFSGVQPSGKITIGNYLGTMRNWKNLQEEYNCLYCLVDMHAITVEIEPALLRANTYDLLAWFLACGVDPDLSIIFAQSHVSGHSELAWILNSISYVGELSRMTQFKDKSSKQNKNSINMALMDYPVLMASDILLYNADVVPVGADQKQHLELARDLATRFNNKFSPTFTVPEPYIPSNNKGGKIMSLVDGSVKMSKSDENENAYISLSDNADTIRRKIKRATTDSDTVIKYSADKKEISNLLTIYSLFTDTTIAKAEKYFANSNYGQFKQELADAIIAVLQPLQQKQQQIVADKAYLNSVLNNGAQRATELSRKMLSKVFRKVGFVEKAYK